MPVSLFCTGPFAVLTAGLAAVLLPDRRGRTAAVVRAFYCQVTPAGGLIPVGISSRVPVNIPIIVCKQDATLAFNSIDIADNCFLMQVGPAYRPRAVTFAFFDTGVITLVRVFESLIVGNAGAFMTSFIGACSSVPCFGDSGALGVVPVKVIVPFTTAISAAISAVPVIAGCIMRSFVIGSVAIIGIPFAAMTVVVGPCPVAPWAPITIMVVVPVVAVVPITTGVITHAEWSPAPTQAKVPAIPGVIADAEAPGTETRVIVIG